MTRSGLTNSTKERQAVSTTSQSRIPIFKAVKCLKRGAIASDTTLKTQWGEVVFRNSKLTQVHRDLLDCVFTFFYGKHQNSDGSCAFLVDLSEIQKHMGIQGHNHAWLREKFEELRTTSMIIRQYKDGRAWTIHTGILRKFLYSQIKKNNAEHLFGGGYYFAVVVESEYMRMFETDLNIHSEKLTQNILDLDSAYLKAVVRFCVSHRQLNMTIDDVMAAVGVANISDGYRREKHRELRDYADTLKIKFGITITSTHIFYVQHPLIWFDNPQKKTKAELL